MKRTAIILAICFCSSAFAADNWVSLFNGKDLMGWHIGENPSAFTVEDGCLVVNGTRGHAFYIGKDGHHECGDFHFKAKVKTMPKSNSGIYFHTHFQAEGWPQTGYEAQVNNTHGDPKKTGGLYNVQDNFEAPAEDGEWFDFEIIVKGKHVLVMINGKVTADYTEPQDLKRPTRQLSSGTFALQAHDPVSKVYFKDLMLKVAD